mgnify:CR=1 FL=1
METEKAHGPGGSKGGLYFFMQRSDPHSGPRVCVARLLCKAERPDGQTREEKLCQQIL